MACFFKRAMLSAAADTPTIGFDLLYAFIIVRLARRDLVWINVTLAEQSSAPECRCPPPRRKRHHDHNGTRRIGLSHRRPGRGHHDRRCREARDE
jgi:hypothetical protein